MDRAERELEEARTGEISVVTIRYAVDPIEDSEVRIKIVDVVEQPENVSSPLDYFPVSRSICPMACFWMIAKIDLASASDMSSDSASASIASSPIVA